jgi:hypothetical protein
MMRQSRTRPRLRATAAVRLGDVASSRKGTSLVYPLPIFYSILILVLTTLLGCSQSPVAPARAVALNLSIPITPELKNSLLGTTTNSLHYRVDGSGGVSLIESTTGPFSAPVSEGSVDFTLDIPPGGKVLSLELDSYRVLRGLVLENPLAVGAVGLDYINGGSVNATVEMGSILRTCYQTDGTLLDSPNFLNDAEYAYGFDTDVTGVGSTAGTPFDIAFLPVTVSVTSVLFQIADASAILLPPPNPTRGPILTPLNAKSIAYLGNGDLLDYDFVPPDADFFQTSGQAKASAAVTTLESGDIYCVKTATMPGGHAWIEIIDPGALTTGGAAPTGNGTSFEFRVNRNHPYYAYDETAADAGNTCSTTW